MHSSEEKDATSKPAISSPQGTMSPFTLDGPQKMSKDTSLENTAMVLPPTSHKINIQEGPTNNLSQSRSLKNRKQSVNNFSRNMNLPSVENDTIGFQSN